MAKTYVDAVKYLIRIQFQIKGVVDKPDIVGAVFGQSEGLLGEEMDLRELQKKGRVGRIEVSVHQEGGVTRGEIHVPTSMDMAETSVLAAAIETVDKVGPCESQFVTKDIEDVRRDKRAEIAKRAKELLARLKMDQSPEIDTLTEEIRSDVRAGAMVEYGRDRLAAGPEVDSAEEVIVVEGRADVVNMLKHGFKNVIGMGGSKISQDIVNLSRRKNLVLFVDGDRGGELNARKLHQIANVPFVSVAPDGKEVEELQQKEIIQALRRRVPVSEFLDSIGVSSRESSHGVNARAPQSFERRGSSRGRDQPRAPYGREREMAHEPELAPSFGSHDRDSRAPLRGREPLRDERLREERPREERPRDDRPRDDRRRDDRPREERPRFDARPPRGRGGGMIHKQFRHEPAFSEPVSPARGFHSEALPSFEVPSLEGSHIESPAESSSEYSAVMSSVRGKKIAKFLDASQKELASFPVRDVVLKLKGAKGVHTVVFDGIITDRLVDAAAKANVQLIVGLKRGKLLNTSVKTLVVS